MAKIASNFYNGGLVINKEIPALTASDTWECISKVKFNDEYRYSVTQIFTFGTPNYVGFLGRLTTEGKLQLYMTSNGSSWDICNGSQGSDYLNTNTWYWVRYKYNGTSYTVDYSTDNTNWINQITVTPSTPIAMYVANNKPYIGYHYGYYDEYWKGQINLSETKIKINDILFFDGSNYRTQGLYNRNCTITSGIASGFSKSDGNYKYIDLNAGPYTENNAINFKAIMRVLYIESNNAYYQDLVCRSSGNDRNIGVDSNNKTFCFYNGSYHYFTKTLLTTNTWYWLGWTWNNTTYKFYLLKDDGTYSSYKQLPAFDKWSSELTINDNNNIFGNNIRLGCNTVGDDWDGQRYWHGSIDLSNSVMGDNVINWSVAKEGFISQFGCEAINQDITKNITLVQGVKLTIVPNLQDANVVLYGDGYQQTPGTNTITAPEGTVITYTVTHSGYAKVTGTYTMTSSDYSLNVTLSESSIGSDPRWTTGSWDWNVSPMSASDNVIRGLRGNGTNIYNDIMVLTDGVIDGSTTEIGNGATLTYTFSQPTSISEIRIYSLWQDSGRDGININSIYYNDGTSDNLIPNSSVNYDPNTSHGYAYLKDSVTDKLLADNVHSITINFGPQDNYGTGYSEIEIRK